jgi:phage tail tape-measure protein
MPPRRARANPPANNVDLDSSAVVLAALQAMQKELVALRQAIPIAPVGSALAAATQGATIGAIPVGVVPGGAAKVAPPDIGISLMQWIGLKLDSFDGSGSLVEAADWLTYVEDKMTVF